MVVTRAQDASTSCPVGFPPLVRQLETNLPAADPPAACPPSDAAAPTVEQLATLTQQVQTLTAMVHGLQHQQSMATQHQTAPPASQQSARGGSPPRGADRRQASPRKPRREPLKRPRSPACGPSKPPLELHHPEEPRRKSRLPRPSPSFSSSSSSSEPSRRTPAISRQAEERMDEYNRRLDELARKINHQPEEKYDTRPPYT